MNKKPKGFYYLAQSIHMPSEGYTCARCINTCPEHEDVVSVYPAHKLDAQDQRWCLFCERELSLLD